MPPKQSTRSLTEVETERVRERLRELVKEHGSQVRLSEVTGISQQSISDILRGGLAGTQVARKLSDHLGIYLEDLVSGKTARAEPRLSARPDYEAVEREARRRFRRVSDRAWAAVANLRSADAPDNLTSDFIGRIASEWDLALSGAGDETDEIREEMRRSGVDPDGGHRRRR